MQVFVFCKTADGKNILPKFCDENKTDIQSLTQPPFAPARKLITLVPALTFFAWRFSPTFFFLKSASGTKHFLQTITALTTVLHGKLSRLDVKMIS